jgi:nucleotide-binding universal stress UspA family protein
MFKRILFATDGSVAAERVLQYVEHVANVEKAEVIVCHAYELPTRYTAIDGYDELVEKYSMVAQAVVDDAVGELQQAGVNARGLSRLGAAAEVILMVADEEDANLIVMGARGAPSLAEVLLGNVSQQVIRNARCPVLIVP